MKTLILMRHGEAQNDSPEGDIGRELTPRGELHAEVMGRRIAARVGVPGLIITSPALRARQTAQAAARGAGYPKSILPAPLIYNAEWEDVLASVQTLPELPVTVESALVVGHNPGLPLLAAQLHDPQAAPPSLPPAGVIILRLGITDWKDAETGTAQDQIVLTP